MTELEVPQALDPERDGKAIAVAITITSSISANRQIVMQTYMPRDATAAEFNGIVDKLTKVVNRQEDLVALPEMQKNLAFHEKTLKQLREDMGGIERKAETLWKMANKRGPVKLTAPEEAQKTTAETNVKRYEEEIGKITAAIKDAERRIAEANTG